MLPGSRRTLTAFWAVLAAFSLCGCDLSSSPPAPTATQVPPTALPLPTATEIPTAPILATATKTPSASTSVLLQPAVFITPTSISTLVLPNTGLPSPNSSFNSGEPIHSLAWAPTGDKFLYVTKTGNLYWANLDGSSATLLQQYEPDTTWRMLEDQQPMSNTLILEHAGPIQGTERGPGHLDVVHFGTGQTPTLNSVYDTGSVFQIRWWRSDRASGIVIGPTRGGEQLVTLDANGHLVEQRNIPYMYAGAVQPGGTWLAYATGQEGMPGDFVGSSPQTIYLLNLKTGQRLQVTAPGMGWHVFNWSPDGHWIYASAVVNGALEGVLISSDGTQWIVVTPPGNSGWDAVWSPDSKHLAFSIQSGGQDDPNSTPVPYNSQVYLVDVVARTLTTLNGGGPSTGSTNLMLQPTWSPDGSQLALLSFDAACSPLCSGSSPAVYLMPFSPR